MSADGPLQVDYTITEEDVYRFLVYHLLHNRVAVGFLAVETVFLFGITVDQVYYQVSGIPIGAAVLCGLLAVAAVLLLYRQLLRRMAKGRGQATIGTLGEHTVEITPDGFVATSARGEGRLKWTAFLRIVGAADYIYFYMGKRLATIVPRRAFPSLAASETFYRAASEWHDAETSLPTR